MAAGAYKYPVLKLSAIQRYTLFARAYVFTHPGNGTRSALAAKYSPKNAANSACRLLKLAQVQALIEQMRERAAAKIETNGVSVIEELAKLGFSNMQDYVDDEGKFIGMAGLTRDQTAALQELEIDEKNGKRRIKLANKRESLELLAKHFKLIGTDDRNVTNQVQVIVLNSPRPARSEEMIGQATVEAITEAIDAPMELETGPPEDLSED